MDAISELIASGKAGVRDLATAVNASREMAVVDLISVVVCHFCGKEFLMHPQDAKRILWHNATPCCWSRDCRQRLKAEQNAKERGKRNAKP